LGAEGRGKKKEEEQEKQLGKMQKVGEMKGKMRDGSRREKRRKI